MADEWVTITDEDEWETVPEPTQIQKAGQAVKEAVAAPVRTVESMAAGGIGGLTRMGAEASTRERDFEKMRSEELKLNAIITPHIKVPAISILAEHLTRKYGWKKGQAFYDKKIKELADSGKKIQDFWEEQAGKGWEAPNPEITEARWRDRPVSKTVSAVSSGLTSIGIVLGTTFLTKSPHAGLAVLASSETGSMYGRLRDENVSVGVASKLAQLAGAWTYVTEKIGFEKLLKPSAKTILNTLKKSGWEGAQEVIETMGHNLLEYFGYDYKDLKSIPTAVKSAFDHMMDGWMDALVGGIGAGGITSIVLPGARPRESKKLIAIPPTVEELTGKTTEEIEHAVIAAPGQTLGDSTEGGTLIADFNETGATIEQSVYQPTHFFVKHQGETHEIHAKDKGAAIDQFMVELEQAQPPAKSTIAEPTPPVTEAQPTGEKGVAQPVRMTRKRGFKIGHGVPEILGWTEDQRRDFMKETIGVESMKDVPKGKKGMDQLRTLTDALNQKMQEAGLVYEAPVLPTKELIETVERTKEVTAEDPIRAINRKGINKIVNSIKKKIHTVGGLFYRTERFFESLDGHKKGIFYDTFWTPVNDACNAIDSTVNQEAGVFMSEIENQDIDTVQWLGVKDIVPGTNIKLTASQRIGVYTLSKNKNGLRYLKNGMNLTAGNITAIEKQMSNQEIRMAEWLLDKYEAQWPILQQAAKQAGIDLKTLKKEFRYAPIIRTDVDLESQEDFLTDLAEPFHKKGHKPEAGMTIKRKKGAIGQVELDAFVVYLHNIARVQRFITMAPLANKLSKTLNDKSFKQVLNDRTYGQGSKLINSWLKDAIKGSSAESTTFLSKTLAIMRINGIVYAIGYNVPSSLRQTLSGLTAIAVDPLMMKYMPVNVLKAMTPSGYQAMEAFVYDKAPAFRHRNMDRDIRRRWNKITLKRNLTYTDFGKRMKKVFGAAKEGDLKAMYMYYKSGKPFSQSALRWIKFMDKHTVVTSWKSLYDVAIEKGSNETDAIKYANKWVGRTQPMGDVQHLPQFFRDGPLEKLISTFNNFINQYGNFYYHDIYQAKKKGEIGISTVAHRVMWSYVLPAVLFGMIGRARLPKDWKEIAVDLGTYPIMPLMIIGRLIDRMIRGWGNSGTIAETAPEAAVAAGRAAIHGDIKKVIKEAAKAVAAFKGVPPTAQMIRTTEGIIDLAAGTTQDPRRLIYSKWALGQGKRPAPSSRGRRRARRVRPRKRRVRR